MDSHLQHKISLYQLMVIFSLLFAFVGFTYNVWRMEVSEQNNTVRTACFEMLLELSALEQLIYSAHYDNNLIEGSPRKGWVKVGLISDLSLLTADTVQQASYALTSTWTQHWSTMQEDENSVNQIVKSIDAIRSAIKSELKMLN